MSPADRCSLILSLLFGLLGCWALAGVALAQPAAAVPAAETAETTATGALAAPPLAADEARRLNPQLISPGAPSAAEPVVVPPSAERRRLGELRQALTPQAAPEAALRIRALEGFLDYDREDQIIYGPGRTEIRYGRFYLEADKVILDARLQEVQAEGNVVMQIDQDKLNADSLIYNFRSGEGRATNVSGSHDPVYFSSAVKKGKKGALPQFEKVSKEESVFRNTNITTCDFKVPHYSVKGREVILYQNDRLFFRGATFYVWGVPTLYLPFYSRSLVQPSPWFTQLGYGSRTGFRIRQGYSYHHQTEEPSQENEDEFEKRSAGRADTFVDYLSKLGPGAGFDYNYMFEYGKHKGQLQVYGLEDSRREVVGATPGDTEKFSESERWRFFWQHRTDITEDLNLIVNIDEFSDPDIFYDVLDLFGDNTLERKRQVVRRGRVALTNVQEDYVVRIMGEIKDRIGINRFNDFSNPRDDNRDFDLDPFTSLKDSDVDGIGSKRWGRVSERLPQVDIATRHLPIGDRPLYYDAEAHMYNNLDKGLNIVSGDDDAYVQGGEFYNRLTRQWKLSERYTLVGKAGVGVGSAERDGDSLGIDFGDRIFPTQIDGLTFVNDKGTFLVGERRKNLDQINPFYAWGDTAWNLNARFSDALTGNLIWRLRETTDDYIGDFYASLGDWLVREDLYNYPIREHWVEGELKYRLARPLLTLNTSAGYNLISRSDVYSKEPLAYWRAGFNWSNQRQTLVLAGGPNWRRRQIFDPTDPDAVEEDIIGGGLRLSYAPIHQRWYTALNANYNHSINGDVERDSDKKLTFFTDEDADSYLRWTYGRELGPKYRTEFTARWDQDVSGLREVAWLLQRDMHDAIAVFRVSLENDDRNVDSRDEAKANQMDVRFGLKAKMPGKPVAFGAKDIKTLQQQVRQPAMAY